jgi:hypothetical protein
MTISHKKWRGQQRFFLDEDFFIRYAVSHNILMSLDITIKFQKQE